MCVFMFVLWTFALQAHINHMTCLFFGDKFQKRMSPGIKQEVQATTRLRDARQRKVASLQCCLTYRWFVLFCLQITVLCLARICMRCIMCCSISWHRTKPNKKSLSYDVQTKQRKCQRDTEYIPVKLTCSFHDFLHAVSDNVFALVAQIYAHSFRVHLSTFQLLRYAFAQT